MIRGKEYYTYIRDLNVSEGKEGNILRFRKKFSYFDVVLLFKTW